MDFSCRPSAVTGDGPLPGISLGHARAAGDQEVVNRRWASRSRPPQIGVREDDCEAVCGLRLSEDTPLGAVRASHRPVAPAGAGWRRSPLRAPPPRADYAVPPGAAA